MAAPLSLFVRLVFRNHAVHTVHRRPNISPAKRLFTWFSTISIEVSNSCRRSRFTVCEQIGIFLDEKHGNKDRLRRNVGCPSFKSQFATLNEVQRFVFLIYRALPAFLGGLLISVTSDYWVTMIVNLKLFSLFCFSSFWSLKF